ncbi:MAG: hypothetical protein ACPG7F_11850 [Aggregatilineales bacterium]
MSYGIDTRTDLPAVITTFTGDIDFAEFERWAIDLVQVMSPLNDEPIIYNICDVTAGKTNLAAVARSFPMLTNHTYFQARIAADKITVLMFVGQNPMADIIISLAKRLDMQVPLFRDMTSALAYINLHKTQNSSP